MNEETMSELLRVRSVADAIMGAMESEPPHVSVTALMTILKSAVLTAPAEIREDLKTVLRGILAEAEGTH